MKERMNVVCSLLLLVAAAFPMWACGIESVLEAQVKDHVPSGFVKVSATAVGGRVCGTFTSQCSTATLSGTVTLRGRVGGRDTTITVGATLKATGPAGASFCLDFSDPLLIQLPLDATNIVGTYVSTSGGPTFPLLVQSGLISVPTTPSTSLVAEPGQQLVLLATPDGLPLDDYNFFLDFDLASIRPITAKMAMLGKVTCGDPTTYYPPVVPCNLTSMAQLSGITIPVSPSPVPIPLALDAVVDHTNCSVLTGCANCAIGVDPGPVDLRGVRFESPSPNPASKGTTFVFVLPGPANVTLSLFDSRGRKVRDLLVGAFSDGRHAFYWDGLDAHGRKAGPGVYYARLEVNRARVGQKTVTVIR